MRVDPSGKGWVHNGLRGWSDGDGFLEIRLTTLGDPGDFWAESFDVFLLLVQGLLRDEHGEVGIFDSVTLDEIVEKFHDVFPDVVGPGSEDIASGDIVVVEHFRLGDDLGVPLGEVLLLLDGNFQSLFVFSLVLLLLLGLFWLFLFFFRSFREVEDGGSSLDGAQELIEEFFSLEFQTDLVIGGMESPEFVVHQVIVNNKILDNSLGIV